MENIRNMIMFLITGFIIFVSCSTGEEIVPQENLKSNSVDGLYETSKYVENMPLSSKTGENEFLKSALKFEAIHQVPLPPGGEIPEFPLPEESNGNRFYLSAPIMTLFSSVNPMDASGFLLGGLLYAEMNAFWKAPDNDPTLIMLGTGPAKGEFTIVKDGTPIWKGTITGVRQNLGTDQEPLFQWKGKIIAEGMGEFDGLKLSAIETTDPSPFPAMVYYWSGVITP